MRMRIAKGDKRLGILQPDDYYGEVTGTIVMMTEKKNEAESSGEGAETSQEAEDGLKRTAEGIILHPQPQNNPNDPLNWPVWRRDLSMFVIGFHSFIIGGQTAILASAFVAMAAEFEVTTSKLAYLVGAYMLSLGVGSVIFAPFATIFGKRLIYLVALVVWIAGSVWGGASHSFESLLGARIIMGLGGSPTEALPSSSIAEIYFQHERAYRLGIYTLLLLGGKNILPMISAFIISSLGWNWLFWIEAMIVGLNLVLTFFFVPETFWDRTPVPDARSQRETERAREARANSLVSVHTAQSQPRSVPSVKKHKDSDGEEEEKTEKFEDFSTNTPTTTQTQEETSSSVTQAQMTARHPKFADQDEIVPVASARPAMYSRSQIFSVQSFDTRYRKPQVVIPKAPERKKYVETLQVYYGKLSKDKLWMIALRPFILFAYPNLLFSIVTYSMSVVWLITISEVVSEIFTSTPYSFPDTSVGLLYVATFVGSCLGSAIAGRLSDIAVRAMTRRNHGIYEPEFRLVMILPVMITVTMGLMGFGWSAWEQDHWIVPSIFLGFLGFGCSLGSTTAITYAVDSYKMFASEALVSLNLSKNVIGFLFSLFVPKFNHDSGSKWTYVTFGIIQVFLCAWAIPLYIYGKRIRHWTDRVELMKWLYVDEDDEIEEEESESAPPKKKRFGLF